MRNPKWRFQCDNIQRIWLLNARFAVIRQLIEEANTFQMLHLLLKQPKKRNTENK